MTQGKKIVVVMPAYNAAVTIRRTRYHPESSSINFRRSVVYGLGCLATAARFRLAKARLLDSPLFPRELEGAWREAPAQ